MADFIAGNTDAVDPKDIINIDHARGRVTFKVRHLSVFSVGARSADTNGDDDGDDDDGGGFCFVTTWGEDPMQGFYPAAVAAALITGLMAGLPRRF
jgi:hypothetical protein